MKTEVICILENEDANAFDNKIDRASAIIKNGGLVAFPTETVYGLGADAKNKNASKKIYAAKGRPLDNPLIVHISDYEMLDEIAIVSNPIAKKLMDAFWPGALTLIFKKKDVIPYETSGGLDTVAVRFPKNMIAQNLIKKSGPIAAPSANISGRPSPTSYIHVLEDLDGKIDMIINGNNCEYGIESTIIDMTNSEYPILLRPGSITVEMINSVIDSEVSVDKTLINVCIVNNVDNIVDNVDNFKPLAPGMKYKHYAPKAEMTIVCCMENNANSEKNVSKKILELADVAINKGAKVGILATKQTAKNYDNLTVLTLGDKDNSKDIARNLFGALREFDKLEITNIYSESFSESGLGFAIMNRLKKAAGYNIVYTN